MRHILVRALLEVLQDLTKLHNFVHFFASGEQMNATFEHSLISILNI